MCHWGILLQTFSQPDSANPRQIPLCGTFAFSAPENICTNRPLVHSVVNVLQARFRQPPPETLLWHLCAFLSRERMHESATGAFCCKRSRIISITPRWHKGSRLCRFEGFLIRCQSICWWTTLSGTSQGHLNLCLVALSQKPFTPLHPSPACPSPARPLTACPSPAHPSPACPSPAFPSTFCLSSIQKWPLVCFIIGTLKPLFEEAYR